MIQKIKDNLPQGFANPSHPVWPLLKTLLICLTVLFFLYINATSFDSSELTIIFQVLLSVLGIEVFQNRMQNRNKKKEQ